MKRKADIIAMLKAQIANGTFRIKHLKSFETADGPKIRTVQAPSVIERVGSNAIMEIVEKHLAPILIENTAASIEGRGPHGDNKTLHCRPSAAAHTHRLCKGSAPE